MNFIKFEFIIYFLIDVIFCQEFNFTTESNITLTNKTILITDDDRRRILSSENKLKTFKAIKSFNNFKTFETNLILKLFEQFLILALNNNCTNDDDCLVKRSICDKQTKTCECDVTTMQIDKQCILQKLSFD